MIGPLLAAGSPTARVGVDGYLALQRRWAGCLDRDLRACHTQGARPGGTLARAAFWAGSDYLTTPLNAGGRAALVGRLQRPRAGSILLDAYGGAIGEPDRDATAFVHRDALCSIQYLDYAGGGGWVRGSRAAMARHVSGEAYQNYADASIRDFRRAYYAENADRLREIKRAVDPDRRFRFTQAV